MLRSKLLLTVICLLFGGFVVSAENRVDEIAGEEICVRQIPGSESALRDYFSDHNLSDTLYSIIFRPANCPRCESAINGYEKLLRVYEPDKNIVLVAVYPDSLAALAYMKNYGFKADTYMFDTDDDYLEFLSFGPGVLHVPYLMKIVPREGRMIVGVNAKEATDDFVMELRDYREPKEQKIFETSAEWEGLFQATGEFMRSGEVLPVHFPDSLRFSEILYLPEFYHDKLIFNDKLNESIFYFRESGDSDGTVLRFESVIKTDSAQNRRFVNVPDDIYLPWLAEGGIRHMPLSPKMLDDTTLAISYSLPKIWFTGPQSVGYMNQSSILYVNPDRLESGVVVPFVKDPWTEQFFYPHFTFYNYGGDIAVKCERLTWPLEFSKEEYVGDSIRNPFKREFYGFDQPVVAVFDRHTGELKRRFGQLPSLSGQTLTGYYFVSPVMDTFNGRIAYSDGFSGEIMINDVGNDEVKEVFRIFEIPEGVIPEPREDAFYSYECLPPYNRIFNRNIIDLRLTDDRVYCLVRYGKPDGDSGTDSYTVFVVDRKGNDVVEWRFPAFDGNVLGHGLRRMSDGSVKPYLIMTKDRDACAVMFEFGD